MKIGSSYKDRVGTAFVAGIIAVGFVAEVDAADRASRATGGFTRSSPAAGGGLSAGTVKRPTTGATQPAAAGQRQDQRQDAGAQRQDGRQESQGQRQDSTAQRQDSRQDTSSQNQSQRQSTAQQMQSTRSTNVTNIQSNYHGGCYNCGDWDNHDAAAGFVVGAIVGGAVVAASQPATTTVVTTAPPPPAPAAPPCNVAPIPVSGVPYYKCGATWYTAGYAANGVVYMPVPPPPGY